MRVKKFAITDYSRYMVFISIVLVFAVFAIATPNFLSLYSIQNPNRIPSLRYKEVPLKVPVIHKNHSRIPWQHVQKPLPPLRHHRKNRES